MKWFKHEVDSIHSEKLTRLKNEFGFEGYGRYWRIMELVAERMDGSNRCHIELPEKEWLNLLSIRRPAFNRYLTVIELIFDTWRIATDKESLLIRIEIPNLLRKRDNYTSDLQASSKKLPNRSRKEVEEEKKKSLLVEKYFEEDWKAYPRKMGSKKTAFESYKNSVGKNIEKNRPLFQEKMNAQIKAVSSGKYLPHGERFFKEWEDLEFTMEKIKKKLNIMDFY